jgi:hypothetical protein
MRALILFCGVTLVAIPTARAQLDPEPRQLLHLGVNQSLHDDGPQAHYLFYYWNKPDFPSTNQILRLVVAPTYLDGELGLKGILGQNTDLGLGLFGGGYEYNYDEVRRGNYYRDESFDGHVPIQLWQNFFRLGSRLRRIAGHPCPRPVTRQ